MALSVTVLAVVWRYGKRQDAGNEETVPEKTETEEAQTEKAQTEEVQTEEIKSPDSKETAEQPEPGSEMEPAFADQNPAEEFYITEISDELFSEMRENHTGMTAWCRGRNCAMCISCTKIWMEIRKRGSWS